MSSPTTPPVAEESSTRPTKSRTRDAMVTGVAVIALAALAAGLLLFGVRLATPEVPADDSVDAGFLRDMQVHHSQAVEMSMIIRDRTDDSDVRRLAYDIALGQQQQVGQMYALLESWSLSQVPADGHMSWMPRTTGRQGARDAQGGSQDHDMDEMRTGGGSSGAMPGMASPTEMQELRTLRGAASERRFLELMIDHHQGGVAMVRAAQGALEDGQVRQLASSMLAGQSAEIDLMRSLLAERQSS